MALSRKIRKQEHVRLIVGQGKTALTASFCAALLTLAWTWSDILKFSLLTTILFWGVLLGNPYSIRSYFPWLNSASLLVRTLAPLLYLLIVLILISLTGN
jgi:hypothetical protein